jgi:micrococcal nuclease
MYEYSAHITKVVDGDTLHLLIDLGLHVAMATTVRLSGVDTPEMGTPEGKLAKVFAEAWVKATSGNVTVNTIKDRREKYGRYLAEIFPTAGGLSLNRALLDSGHAKASPW